VPTCTFSFQQPRAQSAALCCQVLLQRAVCWIGSLGVAWTLAAAQRAAGTSMCRWHLQFTFGKVPCFSLFAASTVFVAGSPRHSHLVAARLFFGAASQAQAVGALRQRPSLRPDLCLALGQQRGGTTPPSPVGACRPTPLAPPVFLGLCSFQQSLSIRLFSSFGVRWCTSLSLSLSLFQSVSLSLSLSPSLSLSLSLSLSCVLCLVSCVLCLCLYRVFVFVFVTVSGVWCLVSGVFLLF